MSQEMKKVQSEEEPQRRRSARLSPLQTNQTSAPKMAPAAALVKRSITVRKIAPRKTTLAPAQHNKENTPKRAASGGVQQKKQKLSTPDNVPARNSSSGKKAKKSIMPSPILPSPLPPLTTKNPQVQTPKVHTLNQVPKSQPQNLTEDQEQSRPPAVDPEEVVWSNKVRRSYSRLSDKSFNSPNSRLTLFGFEKLQTPEVMRKGAGQNNKSGLEASGSFSTLASFTSLLEAEDCTVEPDFHIPGVTLVKEKKRRKKVQKIDSNEVDTLAAKMNAEFEEAEGFELFVE